MKKCLVLGAGGFIGKNLCLKLAEKYSVLAFDLLPCAELVGKKNIKCVTGNFITKTDFSDLLEDVFVVYHLISTTLPQQGTTHVVDEIKENIIPSVYLLESMKKCNVKNIIFASSGGTIYGEHSGACSVNETTHPKCSYGVQKKVIEAYLDFYNVYSGFNCKMARLSNPYGLGQNISKPQGIIPIFIYRLLSQLPITIYGNGDTKRDYIYMDDLTEALVILAEYGGQTTTFNIGSGKAYSINELIEIMQTLSGKRFENITWDMGRDFDVSESILDVKETQSELSWSVKTELEDGIRTIINNMKMCYRGKL